MPTYVAELLSAPIGHVERPTPRPEQVLGRGPTTNILSAAFSNVDPPGLPQRCQVAFLDSGARCPMGTLAYVEFHMVGHCNRFDCDEHGNTYAPNILKHWKIQLSASHGSCNRRR